MDIFKNANRDKTQLKKDLNVVREILGETTNAPARLTQLAAALTGDSPVEGITPQFQDNAQKIYDDLPFTDAQREIDELKIGKSLDERSLTTDKRFIRKTDIYKDASISKLANIDEALGVTFGQIIGKEKNTTTKMSWDGRKSALERELQEAIALPDTDKTKKTKINKAVSKFNKVATEFEGKLNMQKLRGAKRIRLPRISLDAPSKTIANWKNFNKKYKDVFNENFNTKKYSFVIPKDLRTIPELRKDVLNPKSSTYKTMINHLKEGFNEYDEKKLFQKIKKMTPAGVKKIMKKIPRLASVDGNFETNMFASADNIMTSGVQYVDDVDKNFVQKNPWTSGAGVAGATAATLAGSKVAPKDPLKKARQKIKSGLGKTFRTLGTRAAAVPWAAWTIADNLKKGENIADAVIDPWVGAELMFPNLFKENVAKITKKPWVRNLLKAGKYGRMFTPIGAGITAAGLGIDAYKIARDEYQKMQGMTEQEKSDYLADQYEDLGGVYGEGAADGGRIGRMGGGIAAIRKPHAIPPERQGLRSIMINGKKS